jgi:cation transport ATPase
LPSASRSTTAITGGEDDSGEDEGSGGEGDGEHVAARWAAAILMSASAIIVALNAQLLRRVDRRP